MHASATLIEAIPARLIQNLYLQDCMTGEIKTLTTDLDVSTRDAWVGGSQREHSPILRSPRKAAQGPREIFDDAITAV